MNRLAAFVFGVGIMFATAFVAFAQEQPSPQPTPASEDQEKEKADLNKKAYRLLDQVIDDAQSLKLVENRVRVQINAADLLWDHNQARARSLFALAADGVADMMRAPETNDRQNFNPAGRSGQLRQELVLTVARHDAPLAYQLLAATRPAIPSSSPAVDPRNAGQQLNSEDNLEQNLLAQVATLDPKLAGQNAEQMLEKGQFPRSLTEVIAQLQRKDEEAATRLTDKTLKRLESANMLTATDAGTLALSLLAPGPRMAVASSSGGDGTSNVQPQVKGQVLDQSAYTDLMGTLIDSALKATPQTGNNQRFQNNPQ